MYCREIAIEILVLWFILKLTSPLYLQSFKLTLHIYQKLSTEHKFFLFLNINFQNSLKFPVVTSLYCSLRNEIAELF